MAGRRPQLIPHFPIRPLCLMLAALAAHGVAWSQSTESTLPEVTVKSSQLIKDASIPSLGELFHYVPGAVMHQGEGNRDQIVIRGTGSTADFYLNGCAMTPRCSATSTTSSASRSSKVRAA